MKKSIYIFILLFSAFLIIEIKTPMLNARAEMTSYNFEIKLSSVKAIEYLEGLPYIPNSADYNYFTDDPNELAYIIYYINAFSLIYDGEQRYSSDNYPHQINLIDFNGEYKYILLCGSFCEGCPRLNTPNDMQYALDHIEYLRFLELIHAMKAGDFKPMEPVTYTPSPWAAETVKEAVQLGFVPKMNQIDYIQDINRLEFCQIAYAFLKEEGIVTEEPEVAFDPFYDTLDPAVIALNHAGIIEGKSETTFQPFEKITREEMAVILDRIYQVIQDHSFEVPETAYVDKEQISDWAAESVKTVTALQIMQGKDGGKFAPGDYTTKEESIVTLLRLYHPM